MHLRRYLTFVLLCLVPLALVACGSSGSSGSSASGGSSSASGSSSDSYTLMAFFPLTGTDGLYTQWANTFTATVKQINAAGGIHGHKINGVICDTGITAPGAVACGREAVSDHAFGIVDYSQIAPFESLLIKAGIPDVNDLLDPAWYDSPVSFPVSPGGAVFFAGFVGTAHQVGCKSMTLINAFPESATVVDAENAAIAKAGSTQGVTVTPPVIVSQSTVDMSGPVAQAIGYKPDCIVVQSAGADTDGIIEAAHSANSAVKVIIGEGYIAPGQFQSLPASLASSVVIFDSSYQETNTSLPDVQTWVNTVNTLSASPKALNSNGAVIWTATKTLVDAADSVKVVNAQSVMAYLNGNHTFGFGLMPPVNFTMPVTPNPVGSRIFNACVIRIRYDNGSFYTVGSFYNVFSGASCQV